MNNNVKPTERMKEVLDSVFSAMKDGNITAGMDGLFEGLNQTRRDTPPLEWNEAVEFTALKHPLRDLVHSDPITKRSFEKPRGYAGDAVLMDMIYGLYDSSTHSVSSVGQMIYEYLRQTDASSAVRTRRTIIARLIDEISEQRLNPRILSLACGHLREAELSESVRNRLVRKFLAIDLDRKSLEVVKQNYAVYGISAVNLSVRDIIRGKLRGERFDLVYSAGLYDYLETTVAKKLTRTLFDLLAEGGTLLITNFLPEIRSVGYMESFMDWRLIYRSEAEMVDLTSTIPRREIDKAQIFVERQENIGFVKLHKCL
jgi:SAM-dependent methyltransferase